MRRASGSPVGRRCEWPGLDGVEGVQKAVLIRLITR